MVRFITKGRGPNRRVIPIKSGQKRIPPGQLECRPGYHRVNGRCVRNSGRSRITRVERTTKVGWEKGPVAIRETKVIKEIKNG